MRNLILVSVFIATCVSSGSALKCYQCVFPGDEKCKTPGELMPEVCVEVGSIEAGVGIKNVCLKSVLDAPGEIKQVTRSCSRHGGSYNACSIFKDHVEHCSVCDSDNCNGSINVIISFWTTLIPVSIAFFLKFY